MIEFRKYKYLLARRVTQLSILFLFIISNHYSIKILSGTISSSKLLDTIPLSDPYAVLQMFFAGVTISFDILLGALIVIIFYAIIGGRAFCSWICPINMVTDLANYLRNKIGLNQVQKRQPASRNIRYWVILISLIISFFTGVAAFEMISPISMVYRELSFGIGFVFAAIFCIFLFDLFILKNGWCGHICPLGGVYSLIGKYSLIKVDHNAQNCTKCMKCKEVCPESQILFMISKSSQQVRSKECTSCGRCIEVCDDEALNFSIITKKGK